MKPTEIIVAAINIFGSVASITGVTLLWARDSIDVVMLAHSVSPVSISILLALAAFTFVGTFWYIGLDIVRSNWYKMWPLHLLYALLAAAGAIWLLDWAFRSIYSLMKLDALFKA